MPNSLLKILLISLMAIMFPGHSSADENAGPSILLKSKTYSVQEGLSQSTVTSVVEDEAGYVWIGTFNGLNRFDGKTFKHYFTHKNSGLPSSFIRSLTLLDDGSLAVGTDRGLSKYNPHTDSFTPIIFPEENYSVPIWSLNRLASGVAIGTENQLRIVDGNLKTLKTYSGDYSGIKKSVETIDSIFIRTYNGDVIDLNKKINIFKNSKDISNLNGSLLITSEDGVFSYSKEKIELISEVNASSIHNKLNDKKSILFSHGHILSLEGVSIQEVGIVSEKNEASIYSGKNAIYVAAENFGLTIVSEQYNTVLSTDIVAENTWSINTLSESEIIITTDDKDILIYNINNGMKREINSEVDGPKSSVAHRDNLYIATTSGLYYVNLASSQKSKLSDDAIFAIKIDKVNDKLYAGNLLGELLIFDLSNNSLTKKLVDPGTPIFDIGWSNDTVYIATQSGLFKEKEGVIEKVYSESIVISLLQDKGKLYFGTDNSIIAYDENGFDVLYTNNKPIFSMTIEDSFLIATSINEIIAYDFNSNHPYTLNEKFGSQNEYNAQSITKNKNKIFFGGISGIDTLSIDTLKNLIENSIPPTANVKELLVFNIPESLDGPILSSPISLTTSIRLKYSDYPFTFTFSSPGSPFEDISYFYQMSGLSESWIASQGINSATYTNLSAGEYTFNVYAMDPLTKKSGKTKSIQIEITPPWWLSTNAKIVYFIISIMIFAVITKAILRRREVQRQIAKSEERLKLSLWGSGDEMWDWDIETGQIYRSNIWGSLEFPRDGQRSGEHGEESNIHPMDQERVTNALNKHFYGETDHFEAAYRVKGKDDQWVWILDRAKIVERDEDDKALRMTGTIKNISNFKQAEEQLRLFERAIENISEGMFILDNQFNFVEVNEACCDLCEKGRNDFIGQLFNFDLYPESYSQQIRNILQQQGSWSNEVESAKGDGTSFLMELTVDAIYDEQGTLSHYVGVFSDISRRKQQEEELRKLTNNDLLTNLPNRSSLMVTLGNLVKKDTHHTLMVLDLDNFKKINDSLGHQVGDELLIKVARRIESTVPYHTSIYRLGGDEFAILVDNNPDIGSSAVIANNVVDAFCSPFELTKDRVVVGVSIGIVLYPEDDQNEQALLRKADIAMYHAKSAGGNRYQFYSESLNRNAIRQLEVENLIREGLRDDLFEVYYQPKIDLKSGKMAGMEALVRLNHPEHGLISPGDFIPLAEENGLIVEIGEVVLRKACFAAQKWRRQELFEGRVAVNLSSQQFALPDLQQRIESILRLTQLPPGNLELEITEGTVIKQPEKAIKVMMQLSKMGVSLALDDFGTGYSSLSYLKRFPIDTLKIDKAFVDDIDKSDRDLKMVDSIITIAHNMGLSVVGEGVEDASQLSILKALKCEEIQGFIYSKAVNEQAFTELLRQEELLPCSVKKQKKINL